MAKKAAATKSVKAKPSAKGAVKPSKPVAKPAAKPVKAAAKPSKPEPKKPEPKKVEAKKPEPKKAAAPVKVQAKAETKAEPKVDEKKAAVKTDAKKAPAPAAKAPEAKAAKGAAPKADAKVAAPAVPEAADAKGAAAGPGGRKGITIVTPKPMKKPKAKAPSTDISALAGSLLSSGAARRPLISSGPNAPALKPLGVQGTEEAAPKIAGKTPFGKKELEHFRLILLRKRAELLGDVSHLEEEALRGESGSLSNMPQHMAEQGSEVYEQSLHLDLAAAGQKLIKEIDDALRRIEAGTFGICELTGKPIKVERLEELPWARHSIEAARELERRSMRT